MENIEALFSSIAFEYDKMNDIISLFLHRIVKKQAVKILSPKKEDLILDLCTGTGDMSALIFEYEPCAKVIGADISSKMLKIARKKHPNIPYFRQNAENMTFKSGIFDKIVMTYGFRNIQNKTLAIKEIKRVLKAGGFFLHLDFGRKSKLYDFYLKTISSIFSKNKEAYYYLINSKNDFIDKDELINAFEIEGFELQKSGGMFFNMAKYQIFKKL